MGQNGKITHNAGCSGTVTSSSHLPSSQKTTPEQRLTGNVLSVLTRLLSSVITLPHLSLSLCNPAQQMSFNLKLLIQQSWCKEGDVAKCAQDGVTGKTVEIPQQFGRRLDEGQISHVNLVFRYSTNLIMQVLNT